MLSGYYPKVVNPNLIVKEQPPFFQGESQVPEQLGIIKNEKDGDYEITNFHMRGKGIYNNSKKKIVIPARLKKL